MGQQVPLRTPMHDSAGELSRTWALFFHSVSGGSPGSVVDVENDNNQFTPDLSAGDGAVLRVFVTDDSVINDPANAPAGITKWTLIIDQDGVGGHNVQMGSSYHFAGSLLGAAAADTRSQSAWLLDQNANNSLSSVVTDQPVPPS